VEINESEIGGKFWRVASIGACGLMLFRHFWKRPASPPYFKRLRELRDELTGKLGIALPVLSMECLTILR